MIGIRVCPDHAHPRISSCFENVSDDPNVGSVKAAIGFSVLAFQHFHFVHV
jgi:hypothetical protein